MVLDFDRVPTDVIVCIFEFNLDKHDLYRCALVSRRFYEAAIPPLYRVLELRTSLGVGFTYLISPPTDLPYRDAEDVAPDGFVTPSPLSCKNHGMLPTCE